MISVNKILPHPKPIKDYKLLSRQENLPIKDYDLSRLLVNKNAESCSRVKIGKKSDPSFIKEIQTFYDKSKKVILRLFIQNGVIEKLTSYQYGSRSDRIISTYKPENKLPSDIILSSFLEFLQGVSQEYQRVIKLSSHDLIKNKKYPKRVVTKKVEYIDKGDERVKNITIKSTPFSCGLGEHSSIKVLKGTIVERNNNYTLQNVSKTDNIDLDMSDKYLAVRFLDPRSRSGINALTRQLLKEKNLDKLNISIQTNCDFENGLVGYFSEALKCIAYKDFSGEAFTEEAFECAVHEVIHAWEIAQIGRLGKGRTAYETQALELLGELDDLEDIRKAVKYSIAKANYPASNKTLSNQNYTNNYLEVEAREISKKAAQEYENSRNYSLFEDFMPFEW